MLKHPMEIGLARPDAIPDGWHYWETITPTPRIRTGFEPAGNGLRRTLPDPVAVVRALPGMPDATGLLGRCAGDWPVTDAELEQSRLALAAAFGDSPNLVDRETARARVRARDPHRHRDARWAPIQYTRAEFEELRSLGLFADLPLEGRIRYAPEHPGWVAEMYIGRQWRTLPGGAITESGEAADRLVQWLSREMLEIMLYAKQQLGTCKDHPNVARANRPIPIRAVVIERDARMLPSPRVLTKATLGPMRYLDEVVIGSEEDLARLDSLPAVLCPDCGNLLDWVRDGAACSSKACGSEWTRETGEGQAKLVRAHGTQVGDWVGSFDRDRFVNLELPKECVQGHQVRKAGARAKRQQEQGEALEAFAADPRLAGKVGPKGMERGAELTLKDGARIRFFGPVRIDRTSGQPNAQVEIVGGPGATPGKRFWLPILERL